MLHTDKKPFCLLCGTELDITVIPDKDYFKSKISCDCSIGNRHVVLAVGATESEAKENAFLQWSYIFVISERSDLFKLFSAQLKMAHVLLDKLTVQEDILSEINLTAEQLRAISIADQNLSTAHGEMQELMEELSLNFVFSNEQEC